MSENQLSAPVQHYVDLRFHFEPRTDANGPFMALSKVTRYGQHYMPDSELERLPEAVEQSHRWQEMLLHEIPRVLSTGETAVVQEN